MSKANRTDTPSPALRDADSHDLNSLSSLGNDPRHWWNLRSAFDIGAHHEFDLMLREVGALPNPAVPAYTAVDARWGWHINRDLELSLVGQNLLDPHHPEWGSVATRAVFGRSAFVKLQWRIP